jgi:hypothetical protein
MLGAAVLGLSLVAVACGSSDNSGGTATGNSIDQGIAQGVNQALGGGSTPTSTGGSATTTTIKQPTSMDEWEALWAQQRADIVKKIKDNHWGKSADGKTVTGPEGFSIDLSKCAAGWSDTEGLTDTQIKIGQAIPLSGTFADYGNLAKAMSIVFDYYSQKGAFKDVNGKTRSINYVYKDDGYDPARTVPIVDGLRQHLQGVRQAQPALHPQPLRDERPPGLG